MCTAATCTAARYSVALKLTEVTVLSRHEGLFFGYAHQWTGHDTCAYVPMYPIVCPI